MAGSGQETAGSAAASGAKTPSHYNTPPLSPLRPLACPPPPPLLPSPKPQRPAREKREREMVGPQYDLVGNPLGAVRATFERTAAAAAAESGGADPVAAFRGKDWGPGDLFRSFLFEQDGLGKVKDQPLPFLFLIFVFFSRLLYTGLPMDLGGDSRYRLTSRIN